MASENFFFQTFKEDVTLILHFQKKESEAISNSFYEANFTLISKIDEDIGKENHRAIFLINRDIKIC